MKKILVILGFVLGIQSLKAQNNITIVTNEPAFWFPASVTLTDMINFPVKIVNLNSFVAFNDSLIINVAVDTGTTVPTLVTAAMQVYYPDSIAPEDTVVRAVNNVYIDPAIFQEGNNTVVIWPMCPNQGTPPDTAYSETQAYLGTSEQTDFVYPTPYPNPTTGIIIFKRLIKPIEEVRILGGDGRHIKTLKNITTISIADYKPGIYYLQYMHEGRLITTRIIKS